MVIKISFEVTAQLTRSMKHRVHVEELWIVTIIQPVGQDTRPVKIKNKIGKIAVIFIDI
mgnify:CR=1 FL=1